MGTSRGTGSAGGRGARKAVRRAALWFVRLWPESLVMEPRGCWRMHGPRGRRRLRWKLVFSIARLLGATLPAELTARRWGGVCRPRPLLLLWPQSPKTVLDGLEREARRLFHDLRKRMPHGVIAGLIMGVSALAAPDITGRGAGELQSMRLAQARIGGGGGAGGSGAAGSETPLGGGESGPGVGGASAGAGGRPGDSSRGQDGAAPFDIASLTPPGGRPLATDGDGGGAGAEPAPGRPGDQVEADSGAESLFGGGANGSGAGRGGFLGGAGGAGGGGGGGVPGDPGGTSPVDPPIPQPPPPQPPIFQPPGTLPGTGPFTPGDGGFPGGPPPLPEYPGWAPPSPPVKPSDGLPPKASAPVPEPGAWSLMIVGFGAMGAMLRWRRRSAPSGADQAA